jgi:hypothetical protein
MSEDLKKGAQVRLCRDRCEPEGPAARDGLPRLAAVDLIHRHDEFVFPTRAARRAAELEIVD